MQLFGFTIEKKKSSVESELVIPTFYECPSSLIPTSRYRNWCSQTEYDILCARRNVELFRSMGYKYRALAVDERADKAHWLLKHLSKLSLHSASEIQRVYLTWSSDTSICITVCQEEHEALRDTSPKRKLVLELSSSGFEAYQTEFSEKAKRVVKNTVSIINNTMEFDMLHWISRKGN